MKLNCLGFFFFQEKARENGSDGEKKKKKSTRREKKDRNATIGFWLWASPSLKRLWKRQEGVCVCVAACVCVCLSTSCVCVAVTWRERRRLMLLSPEGCSATHTCVCVCVCSVSLRSTHATENGTKTKGCFIYFLIKSNASPPTSFRSNFMSPLQIKHCISQSQSSSTNFNLVID